MQTKLFDELLSKEMTRKQFLLHLGLLLLAVSGISGLMKVISDPQLVNKTISKKSGFGSGSYGS